MNPGYREQPDRLAALNRAVQDADSTLAPVDDEATRELFKRFYPRLLNGIPTDHALRQTVLICRQQTPVTVRLTRRVIPTYAANRPPRRST